MDESIFRDHVQAVSDRLNQFQDLIKEVTRRSLQEFNSTGSASLEIKEAPTGPVDTPTEPMDSDEERTLPLPRLPPLLRAPRIVNLPRSLTLRLPRVQSRVLPHSRNTDTWEIPYLPTDLWEISFPEGELEPCYDLEMSRQDGSTKEETVERNLDADVPVFRAKLTERMVFKSFNSEDPPKHEEEGFPRVFEFWRTQNLDSEEGHPMFEHFRSSPLLRGEDPLL